MDNLMDVLPSILFISLIVLVIVLIVLGIKLICTLEKANRILDDIERKSKSLDNVFRVIDGVTDTLTVLSDSVVSGVTRFISWVIPKKKGKKGE